MTILERSRTLALAVAMLPAAALGQPVRAGVSVGVSTISAVLTDATGRTGADGLTGTAEARVEAGRLALLLGYGEGQVGAAERRRTYAEGHATMRFRALEPVELTIGPVARVLVADTVTTRWVHWRGGARYSAAIVPGALRAYAEGWVASGVRSAVATPRSGGSGGIAGLAWQGARTALRLEYALDEVRLGARERFTVERLTLVAELSGGRVGGAK